MTSAQNDVSAQAEGEALKVSCGIVLDHLAAVVEMLDLVESMPASLAGRWPAPGVFITLGAKLAWAHMALAKIGIDAPSCEPGPMNRDGLRLLIAEWIAVLRRVEGNSSAISVGLASAPLTMARH